MSIIYIPFYPSNWLSGTRGLSAEETGVYITLISRMYEMAGPIERDDKRLSRLCGTKSKIGFVKALNYLISEGKIIEVDGGLFNEKVEKVIQKLTNKSSKAKAAAQSRWDRKGNKNKGSEDAYASPKHMQTACQLKLKLKSNGLGKPKPCAFSEFWGFWPVKKNKASAEKAWKSLSDADRLEAKDAVANDWFGKWRNEQPDANPIHASTFLNKKRWRDEFTKPQFKAIKGGENGPTSKSEQRLAAFIGGARRSS